MVVHKGCTGLALEMEPTSLTHSRHRVRPCWVKRCAHSRQTDRAERSNERLPLVPSMQHNPNRSIERESAVSERVDPRYALGGAMDGVCGHLAADTVVRPFLHHLCTSGPETRKFEYNARNGQ